MPVGRVLVNRNAADPEYFQPGMRSEELRRELGLARQDIVVAFPVTFRYWPGIPVLQVGESPAFWGTTRLADCVPLLFGHGSLHSGMREFLQGSEVGGKVIFNGLVPNHGVGRYEDAAGHTALSPCSYVGWPAFIVRRPSCSRI